MRDKYDADDFQEMLGVLCDGIIRSTGEGPLNLVGIRTRGELLAQRLLPMLNARGITEIGYGALDITLYRDDLSEIGPGPLVRPTVLDFDFDKKPLVLVDDVIFTGRTVRAALDALADFGRPSAVRLAVLVDRGGRELPIHPDVVSLHLDQLQNDKVVKVRMAERDGYDGVDIMHRSAS